MSRDWNNITDLKSILFEFTTDVKMALAGIILLVSITCTGKLYMQLFCSILLDIILARMIIL